MSMKIRMDWKGDAVAQRTRRGVDQGVAAGVEHVRDVSAARAPERTGALRASVRAVHEPGSETAAVTFDADHAVYQDENLDYQHDDGGPKFLETALTSERVAVGRIVQAEIRAALGT